LFFLLPVADLAVVKRAAVVAGGDGDLVRSAGSGCFWFWRTGWGLAGTIRREEDRSGKRGWVVDGGVVLATRESDSEGKKEGERRLTSVEANLQGEESRTDPGKRRSGHCLLMLAR
jgi:hypothetical protein